MIAKNRNEFYATRLIGDWIRDEGGAQIVVSTYADAKAQCEQLGSRVPTARDYYAEASQDGLVFIETANFPRDVPKDMDVAREKFWKVVDGLKRET
jgi:hypothetical protein